MSFRVSRHIVLFLSTKKKGKNKRRKQKTNANAVVSHNNYHVLVSFAGKHKFHNAFQNALHISLPSKTSVCNNYEFSSKTYTNKKMLFSHFH